MTTHIIESAFTTSACDFGRSLEHIRPFRGDEGYCEANLVEYYSHALRKHGFRPFLELPIEHGRIDAMFFNNTTFLLLEAKQLFRESVLYLEADLNRLAQLDLRKLLKSYGLSVEIKEIYEIALCDCWQDYDKQQWSTCDFLTGYNKQTVIVQSDHNKEYSWLLAYRKSST